MNIKQMRFDLIEIRVCRFCKASEDSSRFVKYGVRHYAHAACGLKAQGVAFFDNLTDWRCTQFPYEAARDAGEAFAAELSLRCERYAAVEKARAREKAAR